MKMRAHLASILWAAGCVLFLALPVRAGDCSSPDDCASVPDNGTRAACGLGILAGYGLYQRSRKKDKDADEGTAPATDVDLLFGGGAQNASGGSPPDSGGGGGGAPGGSGGSGKSPAGPLGDPGDLPPDGSSGDPGPLDPSGGGPGGR